MYLEYSLPAHYLACKCCVMHMYNLLDTVMPNEQHFQLSVCIIHVQNEMKSLFTWDSKHCTCNIS